MATRLMATRRRPLRGLAVCLLAAAAALPVCSKDEQTQDASRSRARRDKPVVYAVNYPLRYFAERIGGDAVEVRLPAPKGEDPAYWMPDDDTIRAYQSADLILLNGAGYARWVDKVTLPESRIADTSAPFKDRYLSVEEAVTHSHGPEGEHAHTTTAFTVWLDPKLAVEQARAVAGRLTALAPDKEKQFRSGFAALARDLRALDASIEKLTAAGREKPLVVSHPVYDYFTRRYGLNVKSVHFEPDQMPDEKMWENLKALLAKHPARWMIWEGPPSTAAVKRLESIGVKSAVFSPCANVPEQGDYLSVMRENVKELGPVFSN